MTRRSIELCRESEAEALTLDRLIEVLSNCRSAAGGHGGKPVSLLVEITVDGDIVQLEDSLVSVVVGRRGVHLLGRSFS